MAREQAEGSMSNNNLTAIIGSKTGVRIGLLVVMVPSVLYCVSVFYGVQSSIERNTESIDRMAEENTLSINRMADETKELNATLKQHLKDPTIHHRAIDKLKWRVGNLEDTSN